MSDKNIIISKIDIDDKNEPVIVETKENLTFSEQKVDIYQNELHLGSIGKQLEMKGLFSFDEEKIEKRQKLFKFWFTFLFSAIIVIAISYTFYLDFFKEKKDYLPIKEIFSLLSGNFYHIILALICFFACLLVKGLKLSILSHHYTKKFNFKTCFKTASIGMYYNVSTPLAIAEQPFEIYYLSKNKLPDGVASSLPIITVFFRQSAFAILGLLSLILLKNDTLNLANGFNDVLSLLNVFSIIATVGICLCFLPPFIIVFFSFFPRFCSKIIIFFIFLAGKLKLIKNPKVLSYRLLKSIINNTKCLKSLTKKPLLIIFNIALSLLEQTLLCSLIFFTLKFFGFNLKDTSFIVEWLKVLQIGFILYCAVSFIPTPGNSGAADLSFYKFFEICLASGLAFPATFIWRILCFYNFIIFGLIVKQFFKKKGL